MPFLIPFRLAKSLCGCKRLAKESEGGILLQSHDMAIDLPLPGFRVHSMNRINGGQRIETDMIRLNTDDIT